MKCGLCGSENGRVTIPRYKGKTTWLCNYCGAMTHYDSIEGDDEKMNKYEEGYYHDLYIKQNQEIRALKKELEALKNMKCYTEKRKARFTYDGFKGYVFSVKTDRPKRNEDQRWYPIVAYTKTREEAIEKATETLNDLKALLDELKEQEEAE